MTEKEVRQLLAMTQVVYPNYNPPSREAAVNAWLMCLSEYDNNVVMVAFKAYMTTDTSGFAPSIGQLLDKVHLIQDPQELNEMEAWSLVSKALRNGYYGAVEEFFKLPPLVQKAVGSPDNLRNWSQTDVKAIETVIQSNFMRSYAAIVKREYEIKKMLADVRTLIENVNKTSYSTQIATKNQQTIKLSLEDNKSQNKPIKGIPMPKEIKERVK